LDQAWLAKYIVALDWVDEEFADEQPDPATILPTWKHMPLMRGHMLMQIALAGRPGETLGRAMDSAGMPTG
jgi:hypothetical protein